MFRCFFFNKCAMCFYTLIVEGSEVFLLPLPSSVNISIFQSTCRGYLELFRDGF